MMEKIIEIKNKIIALVMEQKILSAIIALSIIMLISIIVLTINENNTKIISSPSLVSEKQKSDSQSGTDKGSKEQITPSVSAQITQQASLPQPSINATTRPQITSIKSLTPTPQSGTPSSSSQPTSSPTPTSQSGSGGSGGSGATQPTSTPTPTIAPPNTNPTSAPSTGPQIVFIGPNGESETYIPPGTPPVEITWARYTNQLEDYAIDYPSNWQIVKTNYAGHEAVFIYAPGADPGDPDVQYISYGWSTYFYPPVASYVGTFTLDGVPGTIYTNGSIGSTYIAGVFQYFNGFLVLNNNVSDETFAYVFNHMLLSLDFNTP